MGYRITWHEKCPNCKNEMEVYYADSSNITEVTCPVCKKEFEIIIDFKLIPQRRMSEKYKED